MYWTYLPTYLPFWRANSMLTSDRQEYIDTRRLLNLGGAQLHFLGTL